MGRLGCSPGFHNMVQVFFDLWDCVWVCCRRFVRRSNRGFEELNDCFFGKTRGLPYSQILSGQNYIATENTMVVKLREIPRIFMDIQVLRPDSIKLDDQNRWSIFLLKWTPSGMPLEDLNNPSYLVCRGKKLDTLLYWNYAKTTRGSRVNQAVQWNVTRPLNTA